MDRRRITATLLTSSANRFGRPLARIFLALALFSVTLLVINLLIGLSIGDLNQLSHDLVDARREVSEMKRQGRGGDELEEAEARAAQAAELHRPAKRWYSLHSLCGIAASLVTVLVNSIAVTYFVGTSRWCREVVETYHLNPELIRRSQQLKRQTFPWALGGMLTVLFIVSFGAASDPGANFEGGGNWVTPHLVTAILGTGFIVWSFLVQVGKIGANYEIIETILSEVRRIRADRGLDQTEPTTPS
jgi:hypothetical protein